MRDLLAPLRGPGRTVEPLLIDETADAATRTVAEAVARQIGENLGAGEGADGAALPPVSEATLRRRGPGPRGSGGTGRFRNSITVERLAPGRFAVTCEEVEPGQLDRVLGDQTDPDMDQPLIDAAVQAALDELIT